jgi:hypothetical protein
VREIDLLDAEKRGRKETSGEWQCQLSGSDEKQNAERATRDNGDEEGRGRRQAEAGGGRRRELVMCGGWWLVEQAGGWGRREGGVASPLATHQPPAYFLIASLGPVDGGAAGRGGCSAPGW